MRLPDLGRRVRRVSLYYHRLGGAWSRRLVHAIAGSAESGAAAYDQLCRDTVEVPETVLPAADWLRLYSFCLRFGFFELGYVLRRKARAQAIADLRGESDGRTRMQGVAALVESRQWDLADRQLGTDSNIAPNNRIVCRALIRLLREGSNTRAIDNPATDPEDQAFRQCVSGRVAAFVGPATATQDDAVDIDRHELVVRCNDVRPEGAAAVACKGSRCDVSYYNRERVRAIATEPGFTLRSGISWAVAKDRASLELLRQATGLVNGQTVRAGNSTPTRLRASRNYTPFLFHGSLTAAPNAFLDLLEHGVASIAVFHTDLMLTVERWGGYDPKVQGRDAHIEKFIRSSAGPHDPVTSYIVLAQLYQSGVLTGDTGFVQAMELGEERYMKRLEQLYGKYGRDVGR